jgi:DNA-directed RNA polymerase specialized sigma24 family protein
VGEQRSFGGLRQVSKAVRDHVRKWRSSPSVDWDDVTQETHANLAEALGPDYGDQIEKAMAEGPGFEGSAVHRALKRCVWRAESSLRRGAKATASLSVVADPADDAPGVAAVDTAIDLAEAMDRLNSEEQQVWELMCNQYHITEIARVLGMRHQRASRLKAKIQRKMACAMRIIKE